MKLILSSIKAKTMKPNRQNISRQAKDLIKRIYQFSPVGCCWHVVLDDNNWDSIEYCKEWATASGVVGSELPCCTKGACQELAALDVTSSILRRARDKAFAEIREAKQVPVFVGCQHAVAFATATCPDCGRTGHVGVSTPAVIHKTMLCTDCTDQKDHEFEVRQS